MTGQDYFISVDEPDDLRRKLLESSKAVIINLKDYHQLLAIRKNKRELLSVLQDQLKELTFLVEKLNKAIPDKQIEFEKELYEEQLKKEAEEAKKREEQRLALIRMQEEKNKAAQAALKALDATRQTAEAQAKADAQAKQQRKQAAAQPKPAPTPPQPTPPPEPQISDLDRLTRTLAGIEDKLNKL